MSLTLDDLQKLIQERENHHVDFKRETSDEVVSQLSTTIAAFANHEGGQIIFGVSDEMEILGCLYEDKDLQRISQEASNCRPAVPVTFEHLAFGSKNILVVKVPRSSVLHEDKKHRFPTRIGNVTDYLELTSILMLARERGLLTKEGSVSPPARTYDERKPLAEHEASIIVEGLRSKDPTLRLEALRDLASISIRCAIFESEEIVKSVEGVLKSGTEDELNQMLEVVRMVALRGTSAEKEALAPWSERIEEIGRLATSVQTARRAYDVLETLGDSGAVRLLVHWITRMDDKKYSELQPANLLGNIRFYGLDNDIRNAMYDLLKSKSRRKRVKARVPDILESVRRSH